MMRGPRERICVTPGPVGSSSTGTVAVDVGVDHGRRDLAVAEEFLNGSDVVAALQKVSRR